MRRIVIALAALIVAVFGIGYVIGQATGITSSAAATNNGTASPPYDAPWMDHHSGEYRPRAAGKVSAINGNAVTITPLPGRFGASSVTTIDLTGTTQYMAGFGNSADKSTVKVGSFLVATGTLSVDGKTLTAARVMVLPGVPLFGRRHPFGGFHRFAGPHADGQVTAVNSNSITIKPDATRAGEQESITTVMVTGSTRYFAGRGATAGKSSVTTGAFILAEGTVSADGETLTAGRIIVLPHGPGAWGPSPGSSGPSV